MLDQVDFEALPEMLNRVIVNNPLANLDLVDLNQPVEDESGDLTVSFSSDEQTYSDSVHGLPTYIWRSRPESHTKMMKDYNIF